MANYFLVLIDGTGPYDEQQYARDFQNSFLQQIARQLGPGRCVYFDGPGTLGLTTRSIANGGVDALITKWASDKSCKLFLAGYSRGGAAAMEVAKMASGWFQGGYGPATVRGGELVSDSVPIEAVFLLDPVSKDVLCTGGNLKTNVNAAYVMYRDQTIWEYSPPIDTKDFASWVDKALAVGFNATCQFDPDRYARKFMHNADVNRSLGNSSTMILSAGVIKGASHGAIGGLPWVERREDQQAVDAAANILNGWLKSNHIDARVKDNSYTDQSRARYPRVTQHSVLAAQVRHQKDFQQFKSTPQYQQMMRRKEL